MTLRLGLTNDADMAPLFFPIETGWIGLPTGVSSEIAALADLEKRLLAGSLDVAPVTPVTYAAHRDRLLILPTPVRAFELAADSIFLISVKRLDQLDKVRVAISPNAAMGEVLLKIIGSTYYGINPETQPVLSEAAALESLQGLAEACVMGGEAAMRAAGWAKAKGYFVEDVTKAWWIMTGLPLPLYLFAVRREWTEQEPNAIALVRSLMVAFRSALQSGSDQRPTLLSRIEARTGLPAEALDMHYKGQRYDLNEAILRGLLEFYRRGASLKLISGAEDLNFFPPLTSVAPAPATPPRRTVQERPRPTAEDRSANGDKDKSKKANSRRSEAQALGLRVIKGGKDKEDGEDEQEE